MAKNKLNITNSIKKLDESDISDNIYHYKYNTKHLLSLIKKGYDPEDVSFLSSYRSFEGEVFENFIYEKLMRYAEENNAIEKFILKGFHQNKIKSFANTLSISEKQQIVYRTKSKEISEFDAIFFTKTELYFVEMTLVKSVIKLRKRLRKKKALLEILFPNYQIKSLIVLNDGATGAKQFPSYCEVWFTKEFSAKDVLEYVQNPKSKHLEPKEKPKSPKFIEAHTLKLHNFRYYNTISWITKTIRSHKKHIIDMGFLNNQKVQRYHDLYTKIYIGYLTIEDAKIILELDGEYEKDQRVVVAVEKKHSDEYMLTYYIQLSRKVLYLYGFDDNNNMTKEKKDPFGITVTEVYHINKLMDSKYELTPSNINTIVTLLKEGPPKSTD